MFLIWKAQTTVFFLKLESKLVPVDTFLFSESYVWFLLIPTSIKSSSPFLVYISFTTSSKFALLRRFITGNCKPCYTTHIFRDPSACEPSSKRPKRPPIACLFFTEVLKKHVFKIISLSTSQISVFFPTILYLVDFQHFSHCGSFCGTDSSNLSRTPIAPLEPHWIAPLKPGSKAMNLVRSRVNGQFAKRE